MPLQVCPSCDRTTPRRLGAASEWAAVNYYVCELCDHVWTTDKLTGALRQHVTPLAKAPNRQDGVEVEQKAAATHMASNECPACQTLTPSPVLLQSSSSDVSVNYYRCDHCAHVWTTTKDGTTILRHVTPVSGSRTRFARWLIPTGVA